MALAISYIYLEDRKQWLSVSNIAYNSDGVGFPDLNLQVFNSDGVGFDVFFTNLDLPPFEPDLDNEEEVARAIAAGRYFIIQPEQRIFEVTVTDGNRTFKV